MGHLHFNSKDMDAHRRFWGEVLGGKAGKLANMDVYRFPGVQVLVRDRESSGGTDGSTVGHLGFAVRDLEGTLAKAKAAGFTVLPNRPQPNQAFVMAPGDVKVEFTEDRSLRDEVAHHHVHFYTGDIAATQAWYHRMFGAKPGKRGKFEAGDIPGANLSYSKASAAVAPTKDRNMDHIGFDVTDLAGMVKRLEAGGAKFDVPYREVPALKLKIAFLTDPWGTYIELTEGLE